MARGVSVPRSRHVSIKHASILANRMLHVLCSVDSDVEDDAVSEANMIYGSQVMVALTA